LTELQLDAYHIMMDQGITHSLFAQALDAALKDLKKRGFKIITTNDGDKDGFPDMITISNKKITQSSQL
jgi:hypothetical protein